MPDEQRRMLQRSAAQGDPGTGQRLLRERVRAGVLPADHVRLAALLGDPAAERAYEGEVTGRPAGRILHACRTRPEIAPRIFCALFWKELGALAAGSRATSPNEPYEVLLQRGRTTVEAIEAWLADPTEGARRKARKTQKGLDRARARAPLPAPPEPARSIAIGQLAWVAVVALHQVLAPPKTARELAEDVICQLADYSSRLDAPIREEVVPWLLGEGDPIRERVAKRGEVEIPPEDLAL